MPHLVQVESALHARQGLRSTVRVAAALPSLDDEAGRPFVLRVGMAFDDQDVAEGAGRAVDSGAVLVTVQEASRRLEAGPWTVLFRFRPTLEAVAHHVFDTLAESIEGLSYVEISDCRAGLTVRYSVDQSRPSGRRRPSRPVAVASGEPTNQELLDAERADSR